MAYKPRTTPVEILKLRILNTRMDLATETKKYYLNKEKGYEGEVQFDLLTEKLQSNGLILNDLQLEIDNSPFQLDTTIIFQETIFPIDVKNYQGDFIFKPDRLETTSGKQYKNPLDQLKRSKFLLGQLLQKHGYNFAIEGYIVFINPEFTLYQAPLNESFIFPTQLNAFMKKLDAQPTNLTYRHKALADKLVSLHQTKSPFNKVPAYDYDGMRKGVTCKVCNSFKVDVPVGGGCGVGGGKKMVCGDCGCEEGVVLAVLRSVEEIKILFPDMKITTNIVYEWCGGIVSKKVIRTILKENFKAIGESRHCYYE
ncbi:nuclease-related domain-containing protein [Neobacillus sp. NPDC058068]|uniref:nuclease-related domain-containing protein n=1 Tax=Neobacillus sp. NPDC058068 TaxID=3346325 RepID=UPI0036D7E27F